VEQRQLVLVEFATAEIDLLIGVLPDCAMAVVKQRGLTDGGGWIRSITGREAPAPLDGNGF
jgi:hypothetical protein